jgi:demethylmacrocin O-methyltransferase
MMKNSLKSVFYDPRTASQKLKIKRFINNIQSLACRNDLTKLAKIYGTDKWGEHYYTPHYQTHFQRFKKLDISLLEIGVGGYDNAYAGGASLRMWKAFFSKASIFSLDIFDKAPIQESRVKIYKGSQTDEKILNKISDESKGLDIIIDDGSHMNEHVIKTFKVLFKKLNKGGVYVIEDTQASYWPVYDGDSNNLQNPNTMMNFFKNMADSINNEEFMRPGYKKNYYDKNIVSIHFYHNMIFIYKDDNNESSNILIDNELPEYVTFS